MEPWGGWHVFPPLPSELIIPWLGSLPAGGDWQLLWVIVVASAGSLSGAWLWYEVGRAIGPARLQDFVERHGRWLALSPRDLEHATRWSDRHGGHAALIGRLVPGVRTLISIPAGLAGMARGPFLACLAVGTVLWTALLATVLGSVAWRYARCFGLIGPMDRAPHRA